MNLIVGPNTYQKLVDVYPFLSKYLKENVYLPEGERYVM